MAMSKTYHTVNGRILGETSGGVRTDYLTDALGSVTATVNSSATVVNTYRHKPYGSRLAKTGAGADPTFQWTGDTGSKLTSKAFAEQYNRARHLSSIIASWTSKDPMLPFTYIEPFTYVVGNPTTFIDPFGLLSCRITAGPKALDNCGGSLMTNQWITGPDEKDGWIVQRVKFVKDVKDCPGTPIPPVGTTREYWEAWRVKRGRIFICWNGETDVTSSLTHDTFQQAGQGHCTQGTLRIVGKPKFIKGNLEGGFVCGGVGQAGWLWSTPNMPPWWSDEGSLDHRLTSIFACCCGEPLLSCGVFFRECPKGPCKLPPKVFGRCG